jgi:dTDP-L-rhamnose 4-epimerase
MTNILITGGAGFIGSNIAMTLKKEKQYDIRILDNFSPQIHGLDYKNSYLYSQIKNDYDFILGDVTDNLIWEKSLKNIDIVVHLAGETGTGQSMYTLRNYTSVNIMGTASLLDYLTNKKHHVNKIIIASSRAIYGEGKYFCKEHGIIYPGGRTSQDMNSKDFEIKCPICGKDSYALPTDEDSKISPISIYGITKQVQEQLVLSSCKSLGIKAMSFRYQNVYGPGQSLKNPYTGILSIFSTRLINNSNINIFEDGKESRDFVFIDDVVNATILGIKKDFNEYLSINVGTGNSVNVNTIVYILKELFKSKSKIDITGNYRLGDIRHNIADISLLKEKLKYEPKIQFFDGILSFVEWVKTQKIENNNDYENSLKEMKEKKLFF